MKYLGTFILTVLLFMAWGCGDPMTKLEPCSSSDPCVHGGVCIGGFCYKSDSKKARSYKDAGGVDKLNEDIRDVDKTYEDLLGFEQQKKDKGMSVGQLFIGVEVVKIEGDGSLRKLSFWEGKKPVQGEAASRRFEKNLVLIGKGLQKLTGIKMRSAHKDCALSPRKCLYTAQDGLRLEKEETNMKRKIILPKKLFTGMFLLIGLIGNSEKVLAKTFLLQGEGCSISSVSSDSSATQITFKCGTVKKVVRIPRGSQGPQGPQGSGCSVAKRDDKATIKCGSGSTQTTETINGLSSKSIDYFDKLKKSVRISSGKVEIGSASKAELVVSSGKVVVNHANLHVQDGSGHTASLTTGKGNLIIGYNENSKQNFKRSGAHNIVVGVGHGYTSYGGVVFGENNKITNKYCGVLGGTENWALGVGASISGGLKNIAFGNFSSISGGVERVVIGSLKCSPKSATCWMKLGKKKSIGAGTQSGEVGFLCASSLYCNSGLSCVASDSVSAGICSLQCQKDSDCVYTINSKKVQGTCLTKVKPSICILKCLTSDACPFGNYCIDGICRKN